jgi:hypothetical protein
MSQWRVDLEAFELVLLRTPENAPRYDDADLERIQAEIMTWYCAPGTMSKPGQAVTL